MILKQLRSISIRELISALERDGFKITKTTGSHRTYRNAEKRRVIISFHHPGQTPPIGTIHRIIKDAGWSEEDLKRLKLIK